MDVPFFVLLSVLFPLLHGAAVVVQSNPCRLDNIGDPVLGSCTCLPDEESIVIDCTAGSLPRFPPKLPADTPISLTVKDHNIASLGADAFASADLISLDLSSNDLRVISANSFRGLEDSLRSLRLSNNKLSELPTWSIGFLTQLATLDLSANRIQVIRNKAFDETALSSLHFLYLQNNQIELVPTQSLRRLRCLVLSLAGNRITSVEKLSFPQSLTILDLSANLLSEIPYLALAEQPELRELDLEANRISKTDYDSEVMMSNELKLTLCNNRITALTVDSFKSFRKFSTLDLSFNEITHVSPDILATISSAKEINLANNRITSLGRGTFENVGKSLEKLNLAWNDMHAVPEALADLRVLKSLNLDGNKLSKLNIKPMAAFRESLSELSLAYNHLSTVPEDLLTSTPQLKELDLSKNRIESVDATWRIGNLNKLMLAANRLTTLDQPTFFAHSPSLTVLDLSFNNIRRMSPAAFNTLLALDSLFLQHNNLSAMPREALISQTALNTLVLDFNNISSLPPQATAPWPRLARLSLASNRIRNMDDRAFASSFKLKYLDLSKNRLVAIKPHTFELLRVASIILSHNEIKQVHSMAFAHINDMRRLDLSNNRLRLLPARSIFNISSIDRLYLSHNHLEHLEAESLYEVRRLGQLDLSHNRLKIFACMIFTSLPRVHELDLSNNYISSLEISCIKSSLTRLNLSHNELQTIEEDLFEGSHVLTQLSVSHNSLLSVNANAFTTVPSLSHIDLSHNHLRIVRKGTFLKQRGIALLDLSHNTLSTIHPEVLGENNLKHLCLAANQIASIPAEGLKSVANSLETLDLSDNYITSIDAIQFMSFNGLRRLILSGNRIHSLEEETFSTLPRLEYLDLSNNPFSSWHPHAFKGLSEGILSVSLARTGLFSIPKFDAPELERLDLSGNNLRELESSQLESIPRLRSLNLSSNSISSLPDRLFANVSSLTELILSSNPLHALSEQHMVDLTSLKTLLLNDMPSLLAFPTPAIFGHLSSLKHLELTGLPLGIINYDVALVLGALPPLERVSLQINDAILNDQLRTLDARVLRSLTVTGKALVKIDAGAFRNLRGFNFDLAVTRTNITEFPSAVFDTLTAIQSLSLDLSHNHLSRLSPFPFTQPPLLNRHATLLKSISLVGNPITCDCHMEWLYEWPLPGQPCSEQLFGPHHTPLPCSAPSILYTLPTIILLLFLF